MARIEGSSNGGSSAPPHHSASRSSSSSSPSSCCRRLSKFLLLVVGVVQIGSIVGVDTETGGMGSSLTYPEYDEQAALRFLLYAKAAFCSENAITNWSCGDKLCDKDKAPILSEEGECDSDSEQHTNTNTNNDQGSQKMIRYIPEGKRYQVQGYVARIPTTTTSASISTPTTNDENATSDGALGSTTDTTKTCIVAFRGSITCKNWVADILFALKPWPTTAMKKNFTSDNTNNTVDWSCPRCKAHHGFASAYDELRYTVHTAIQELQCTSLIVTGHSLGAAVATLASFDLRKSGYNVTATWTYGSPRMGNAQFANSFVKAATSQGVSPPSWRVVHYHDPVPRLNPRIPYINPVVHLPLEIYYTNNQSSNYNVCPPQISGAENKSAGCMEHYPSIKSLNNNNHIWYLNESLALKDFPKECDGGVGCKLSF